MGSFADAKVIKALKFMGGFVEYLEEKGGMLDS